LFIYIVFRDILYNVMLHRGVQDSM